ncbi:hypothetical protein [Thermofilum sp.]|uniref:hypothetical protein n=1 Tax=Thermofilum sp. TaxID=1961369 RepID=UPI00317949D1
MSASIMSKIVQAGVSYHVNVGQPYLADVIYAEEQAVQALLDNYRLVANSPADVTLDPLFPLTDIGTPTAPSKFTDAVSANNYKDDWTLAFQFTSPTTSYKADAFGFRIKADAMVLAFGAVLLDAEAVKALRHINIYRALNKQRLAYTVDVSRATTCDSCPYYYVPLGAKLVVRPSEEVVVELVFSESYIEQKTAGASGTAPVNVAIKVQLLPSVKLIPKASSAYVQSS